jgi:hypothetical protein
MVTPYTANGRPFSGNPKKSLGVEIVAQISQPRG